MITACSDKRVPSNAQLSRLTSNEQGNLIGLLGITVSSSILLLMLRVTIIRVKIFVDQKITKVAEDQKRHCLLLYRTHMKIYERQQRGIELMQVEIEAKTSHVNLA